MLLQVVPVHRRGIFLVGSSYTYFPWHLPHCTATQTRRARPTSCSNMQATVFVFDMERWTMQHCGLFSCWRLILQVSSNRCLKLYLIDSWLPKHDKLVVVLLLRGKLHLLLSNSNTWKTDTFGVSLIRRMKFNVRKVWSQFCIYIKYINYYNYR